MRVTFRTSTDSKHTLPVAANLTRLPPIPSPLYSVGVPTVRSLVELGGLPVLGSSDSYSGLQTVWRKRVVLCVGDDILALAGP